MERRHLTIFVYAALSLGLTAQAQVSVPQNTTLEGRLYDNGVPLNEAVDFKLEVLVTGTACVVYSEEHNATDLTGTSNTAGHYALPLGSGANAAGTSFANAFSNTTSVTALPGCGAVTLTNQKREVRISVHRAVDAAGVYTTLSPNTVFSSVPTAVIAQSAERLGTKTALDFVQINTDVTQSKVDGLFGADYARLQQLLSPSAALGFGGQRLTNLANPSAAQDASTKDYTDKNLAGSTIDLTGLAGGMVLTWDGTAWKAQSPVVMGAAGGDLSGNFPNPVIAASAIGTSKIADAAVTLSKLAPCANNEVLKFVSGTGWTCTTAASLAPVTKVAGKTGDVILNPNDIIGLGTASLHDVGIGASQVPLLDGVGKLATSTIPALGGDVSGTLDATLVTALRGRPVASTAPNVNEILRWNGSRWEASADQIGITALTGDILAAGSGSVAATLANGVVTTPKMFSNPGRNRLVATDATSGASLVGFECYLDEIMHWTTSGWACVSVSNAMGGSAFLNNGNSFAGPATLGTNDNYALNLKANGNVALSIGANGNVGIGTTSPTSALQVIGGISAGNLNVGVVRATGLHLTPATLSSSPSTGDIAIDSGSANSLNYYNGSIWMPVGSGDFFRNGSQTMTGAFRASLGTVSAPGITFDGDQNTGMYQSAADTLALVTGGVERVSISPAGDFVFNSQYADTTGTRKHVNIQSTFNPAAASSTLSSGLESGISVVTTSNSSSANAAAMRASAMFNGSGTFGALSALSTGITSASSGTINEATAGRFEVINNAGTINNSYGVYISQVQGTNSFSVYASDSTAKSYFAGRIGVGTTAPSRLLEVAGPVRLAPSALPGSPSAGDLAIDSGAGNALKYHNGATWVAIAGTGVYAVKGANADITSLSALSSVSAPGSLSLSSGSGNLNLNANTGDISIATSGAGNMYFYGSHSGVSTFGSSAAASITSIFGPGGINLNAGPTQFVNVNSPLRLAVLNAPAPVAGAIFFDANAGNALKFSNGGAWQTVASTTGAYAALGNNSDITALRATSSITSSGSLSLGSTASMSLAAGGTVDIKGGNVVIGSSAGTITTIGSIGVGSTVQIFGAGLAAFTVGSSDVNISNRPLRIAPSVTPSAYAGTLFFDLAAGNALKWYDGSTWQTAASTNGAYAAKGANADITSLSAVNTIAPAGALNIGASGMITVAGNANQSVKLISAGTGAIGLEALGTSSITVGGASTGPVTVGNTGSGSATEIRGPAGINLNIGSSAFVTINRPLILTPQVPGVAPTGAILVDSGDNNLKWYNGTSWVTAGTGDFKASGAVPMTGALRSVAGSASLPGVTFVGDTDTGLFAPAADNVAIATAATERMRILANGYVGIGTTAPTSLLSVGSALTTAVTATVNGAEFVRVHGSSTPTALTLANSWGGNDVGPSLEFRSLNDSSSWKPTAYITGAFSDNTTNTEKGYLSFQVMNGGITEQMRLTNDGKMGIGTSQPAAKLEVRGQMRTVHPSGTTFNNTSTSVNWDNGNIQTMSVNCASVNFTNMLDGGAYTLAVTETSANTCSFAQTGLNFYYAPGNGPRNAGQRTIYTFQRIGTDVYVSWIAGFQ